MWSRAALGVCVVGLVAIPAAHAAAQAAPLQQANIVEHVGDPIPRDLTFTDADGHAVTFGSLIGGTPLVLSLAYFTCPMLCHLGQDGAADAFKDSGRVLGRDFRAVTVSIDPRDRPATARPWRDRAAAHMHLAGFNGQWKFLVGNQAEIARLAEAVGFRYAFDKRSNQFSHAEALFVITPDGRISRYVYGISFDPTLVAGAIDEAAANKIGGPVERFLLRCYCYIPSLRQHAGFVAWLLRVGGLGVVLSLGTLLLALWRRDVRRHAADTPREAAP